MTFPFFHIAFLLIFLSWAPVCSTFAQKVEREVRLKPVKVPTSARQLVKQLTFDRKVKWYQEFHQDGISYEAKGKINGRLYSIEFDTLGNNEDVEVVVEESTLPDSLGKQINKHFEREFEKYRIEKIQVHYEAEDKVLLELILEGYSSGLFVQQYEIEVMGKKEEAFPKLYEFLFDMQGNVLRKAEILVEHRDHLDF